MEVILNIGLDGIHAEASFTNGVRNPDAIARSLTAVQTARRLGFKILQSKLLQSDTEPTVVARVEVANANWQVAELAQKLNQDCIAVWSEREQRGALIGDKAATWGEFNPEFFFLLDGSRLGSNLASAA